MPSIREIVTAVPSKHLQVSSQFPIALASSSASASVETFFFAADEAVKLRSVRLLPKTVITGAAAGAIGYLNLYRGGKQVWGDGVLGVWNYAAANARYVGAAGQGQSIGFTKHFSDAPGGIVGKPGGFAWLGTIGAVTASSSTGATATAVGNSNIADGAITATSVCVVEPGTANEETVTLSAFNTSTGVFTLAGSATFALSHPAGSIIAVVGAYVAGFTEGAVTAAVDTGATLTAIGAANIANFVAATSKLIAEPRSATLAETIQLSAYNSGTGAFTIANGGKFANSHAATSLIVLPFTNDYPAILLEQGDALSFKWTQLGTGLALPASLISVNYTLQG